MDHASQLLSRLLRFSAATRLYRLEIAGQPEDRFLVEAWAAVESLHAVGATELIVLSLDTEVAARSLLGSLATLNSRLAEGGMCRSTGLIHEVAKLGGDGGFGRYRLEACFDYVTLLNLRNWAKLGERYVTEQVYVHTKLMIVDDRYALFGSANINDRSLNGEGDSEIALLVADQKNSTADLCGDGVQRPVRDFARKLRVNIWRKLFGIGLKPSAVGGVKPADHLLSAIDKPACPASWRAIQKQAEENAAAYEAVFDYIPRSWTTTGSNNSKHTSSIIPNWDREIISPVTKEKGAPKSSLPFSDAFWKSKRFDLTHLNSLLKIRGLRISGALSEAERQKLWREAHAFQENMIAVETEQGMLLLLSVATVKTLASDFPEWQQDCVGRMAISLPNDAEIAVVQTRSMLDISNESRISFQDGLPASYSNFLIRGEMRISAPLNARELATFLTEANKLREKILKAAQKDKEQDPSDQEGNVSEYPLGDRQGIALHRGYTSLVAFTLKNHAITWLSVSNANSKFDAPRFVASLISDLQLRPNFSVPVSSGICLPHLLLPVSQSQTRRIGTTYRLKSHPDITIFLEDHTARKPGKYERPEVFTAIYKSNYFWTQRYQDYDSIENLLKFRRHNNIPFAGQRAVESKVRMIRTDKITEDFGYLVVTQGNPDAKVDAPDLMLYVIRDAQQAIKRGIKPVPKKEFFKLARQIADSVKHRGATPSEK